MTLKKLLTMGLAGTLLVGTIATSSAAELDYEWYAKQNPDVVAAVGDSPEALKLHYDMYGRKEARMANTKDIEAQLRRLFNVEEYAKLYPDVKEFYGEDAEAMFMHYISYGLLEARRPSEKVSQAAATSLKKAVEKALTDAGVAAAPGSLELVAVITGESAALAAAKPELVLDSAKLEEVTKALEQVAAVVEKAVTETVKEVTNPAPAPASGGGSSAPAPAPAPAPTSSPNPSPSTTPTSSPSPSPTPTPEPEKERVSVDVSNNDGLLAALERNDVTDINLVDGYKITVTDNSVFTDNTLNLKEKTVENKNGTVLVVRETGSLTVTNGTLKGGKDALSAVYVYNNSTNTSSFASLTLGNGATVEGSSTSGLIYVTEKAKLDVQSGATVRTEGDWAVNVAKGWDTHTNRVANCEVKIAGTLQGGFTVYGERNTTSNDTVEITGTITTTKGPGVYLAGIATTTIKNGAKISGLTGVEVRAGTLTIESGADVSGTKTSVQLANSPAYDKGSSVDGVALAVSQHNYHAAITVTVKSGANLYSASNTALYVTDKLASNNRGEAIVLVTVENKASLNNKNWQYSSSANDKTKLTIPSNGNSIVSGNDVSGNDVIPTQGT